LTRSQFEKLIQPWFEAGSPIAEWAKLFLSVTFAKIEALKNGPPGSDVGLALHDPLCLWYVLNPKPWV